MLVKLTFYSLLAYIFALGWMEPYLSFGGQKIQISDLIFLFVSILFVLAVIQKKIALQWHKSFWILLFFLLTQLLSAFFSEDSPTSFIKLTGKLYLAAVPIIIFHLTDSVKNLKKILQVWLFSSCICAFIGVLSILLFYIDRENPLLTYTLFHSGTLPPGNYPRISSTFLNANLLCNYLSVALGICLILKKTELFSEKLFWTVFLILLISLIFTFSPGLGGVLFILGVWGWFLKRSQYSFLARSFLFAGVLSAFLFLAAASFSTARQENPLFRVHLPVIETTLEPSARMLTWTASTATFFENPLFGKGIGLPVCHVNYVDLAGRRQFLSDAHNIFLNVAAESGFLGVMALLMLAVYFSPLHKSFSFNNGNYLRRGLKITFASAFVYQGLSGSFEDARHLWALIGLILAVEKMEVFNHPLETMQQ